MTPEWTAMTDNPHIPAVFDDVLTEIRRSLDLHGDQDHLPDGVHPHGPTVILEAIGDRTGRALAAHSNRGLSDALRARTKAASVNEGGNGTISWEHILTEEWGEALGSTTVNGLRAELVQVAAVAVKWAAAIDVREAAPS